jgi:hypothetical protein
MAGAGRNEARPAALIETLRPEGKPGGRRRAAF